MKRFFAPALFLVIGCASASAPAPAQSDAAAAAQSASAPDPAACAELPAVKRNLESAKKVLADWPNLDRYRAANQKVEPPAKHEERVVFMGDSITDGWSNPQSGGFFPGKPYLNRGISGQTTPQMLVRFRPDVIALRPKVVVILAGTNDLAGNTGQELLTEIEDNLASMAELARAHGIHVVLASVTPVSDYGHNQEGKSLVMTDRRPPAKILELNAWIKKTASDYGYTYLDYFSSMVDDKGFLKIDISGDGLHPNTKGYAVMGPLAEQAIRTAMKKRH